VAWQQGDLNTAIRLYYALLAANPEDCRALHRLALMRAWNDRHDEALELLDRLLVLQPENCDARLDRARILAWSGDLEGAITEVDGILDQHPTQVPALHARGKFQAWAGLYDASLSTYDQLLAIDPDVERIRISRAQVLAWASRFEAAAAVYDTILIANPDNSEARLGRARICAYTGRLNSSVAAYRLILTDDPHNTEALAGLARTLSWKGHLVESEASWRRALAIEGGNPTFVAGLSQNLRWQGRPAAAHEVLQQISHDSPSTDVVSAEQLWIRASLGPRATPSVVLERDSDGNRMRTISLSSFWHPLPRLGLRVNIYRRNLEQNVLVRTVWGGLLSASRQFVPGWTLSGGLGASKSDGQSKDTFPAVRLSLTSPDRNSLSGTLAYAANALDATALLVENGVEIDEWTATLRGTPAAAWHLRGGLSLAMFAGENRNRRLALNGQLKRRFSRTWTMGFGLRTFTFEKDLDEGYFDPDFYGISEFSLGWLQETGPWSLQWEALPGMQKVTRAGNLAGTFRASARLGYRLAPGREISLSGAFSTTGLHSFSTADPDYSYSAITAGLSWVY
jgi:tetratricopeptide (TPR) repeat protein